MSGIKAKRSVVPSPFSEISREPCNRLEVPEHHNSHAQVLRAQIGRPLHSLNWENNILVVVNP